MMHTHGNINIPIRILPAVIHMDAMHTNNNVMMHVRVAASGARSNQVGVIHMMHVPGRGRAEPSLYKPSGISRRRVFARCLTRYVKILCHSRVAERVLLHVGVRNARGRYAG